MIEQTSWFQLQPLYQYVRKQSENRQFLKYLEIGATFLLIAVFLFFAIMPTASAISSLVGEIKSKETTSAAMSQKIASIMSAQDSFSQIQADYSTIESSYPTNPNFYKAASTFSYVSKESSTPINQIKFQLSDSNQDSFGVSVNTNGSYSSIINSIEKTANARRLMNIKSIQIAKPEKNTVLTSNDLYLNISVDMYYLPLVTNEK
jgi:Tfp pilus assembly protein PilO